MPLLFVIRVVPWAQLVVDPLAEVPDRLGAGDNVERRGQSGAFVKVTHPELRPRKLPLDVRVVLWEGQRLSGSCSWSQAGQGRCEQPGISPAAGRALPLLTSSLAGGGRKKINKFKKNWCEM